jgi:hypothetical protein
VIGKPIDLPRYDVMIDGEKVGEVYAALSRESRHYSSGSVKLWYGRIGGRSLGAGYNSKNDARDALVERVVAA